MKEYRAQLDADRAKRLSKGTNHANLRVKADDMKSKVGLHCLLDHLRSRRPCISAVERSTQQHRIG